MSFSFSIKAATKAEAKQKVAAELDKVVQGQPIHAGDRDRAQRTANELIDSLLDDLAMDVSVSVNGSLGVRNAGDTQYTWANLGAGVGLVMREA